MMESAEVASILARALNEDRLVALVGSGASARHADASGRNYEGLPTPSEFVSIASQQYSYVQKDSPFPHACDEIFQREGRGELESFISRYYGVTDAMPMPPAHRMLAWLPFSAYVTSNYDEFIERSLERERRRPFVVVDNNDLTKLRAWNTPVIKYHGTITRPGSIVATTLDHDRLKRERALVAQLIAVTLAGKSLLVVGHGLSDADLARLIDALTGDLGSYAPNIFVLREAGSSHTLRHLSAAATVVTEDLTQFLNRLLHATRSLRNAAEAPIFDEKWLNSAFFAELKQAATLPSETQVIDAFLNHLRDEVLARDEVDGVVEDADAAIKLALDERPNYGALRRTWEKLRGDLGAVHDVGDGEETINGCIEDRTSRIRDFTLTGRNLIRSNERLLVYSQSQRVLQALRGVPVNIQRTCHVFVAECRPKSPQPYQDAIAICRELNDTSFKVTVCPDVVAVNLLATHQIDRVLMGTHALYYNVHNDPAGSVHSYVNTCGSLAIDIACRAFEVPIAVIGEALKLEEVPAEQSQDHLHSHQEDDLLPGVVGLTELRTRRGGIGHVNIGYDLLPVHGGTTICIPDLDRP